MKPHTIQDTEVIVSPLAKTKGIWCKICHAFVSQTEHLPRSTEYLDEMTPEGRALQLGGARA